MLRTLFILLAVVSTVLAFVLDMWVLYAAAAALLVIAVVFIVASMQKRQRRAQDPYRKKKVAPQTDDELQSLGIMQIRPKGAAVPSSAPEEPALSAEDEGSFERVEAAAPEARPQVPAPTHAEAVPSGGDGVLTIRRKAPSEERPRREVLEATLQGLQAAIGATTVCLLRQEELALKYHIEGIVSKNHYIRSQGPFATKEPLLTPSMLSRPVTVRRVGGDGLDAKHLGYYIEPIAVRQVAVAPVAHEDALAQYFLIADAMEEDGIGSGRQRALIAHYAGLVSVLLDPRDVPLPDDLDADDEAEVLRPRREIIGEEMQRAHTEGTPLALALVYLSRAEMIAEAGPVAVAEAEAALGEVLQAEAAPYRVERFGELTYGVFVPDEAEAVESWAVELQHAMDAAEGPAAGGVAIGIAVLQERHATPDAFRADATEALRAAYESGACTILA